MSLRHKWKKELARPGKISKQKVDQFLCDVREFLKRNPNWMKSTEPENNLI